MAQKPKGIGLTLRILGTLVGVSSVVSVLVVAIVYEGGRRALRGQIEKRTAALAMNLSDAAAGHVLRRNGLELHAWVTKFARLEGVSYAFIRDGKGEIVAHSLKAFPEEHLQPLTPDERRQTSERALNLGGKAVYELRVPILEGQAGTAHLGVWGDTVEEEIYRGLLPVIGLVGAVCLTGIIVSAFLALRITRPIRKLTEVAGKISKGNLEVPIGIELRGEFGDLARSLERMRASLKVAMLRLSRGST